MIVSPFFVQEVPATGSADFQLVMGHGWGQTGAAFMPLAEALRPFAPSLLIDFPGFGSSALPALDWGIPEYAEAVIEWMQSVRLARPVVWVGYSFGGRVGLQLAARYPDALAGMVIIAGAGLPRRRTLAQRVRLQAQEAAVHTARRLLGTHARFQQFGHRFGSADYQKAGALRPIFTRIVNHDLSAQAADVRCPTLLIYGRDDTETPVELGERLQRLISGSELSILEGFGHWNILGEGRHQVAVRMRRFLEKLAGRTRSA